MNRWREQLAEIGEALADCVQLEHAHRGALAEQCWLAGVNGAAIDAIYSTYRDELIETPQGRLPETVIDDVNKVGAGSALICAAVPTIITPGLRSIADMLATLRRHGITATYLTTFITPGDVVDLQAVITHHQVHHHDTATLLARHGPNLAQLGEAEGHDQDGAEAWQAWLDNYTFTRTVVEPIPASTSHHSRHTVDRRAAGLAVGAVSVLPR